MEIRCSTCRKIAPGHQLYPGATSHVCSTCYAKIKASRQPETEPTPPNNKLAEGSKKKGGVK